MARAPNLSRRADLEAALKRVKPRDVLRLEDFAKIWGTSKQNFVNTLRQIENMVDVPEYVPGPRGTHLYPAHKMLRAMISYEKRNDAIHADLAARAKAIMGSPKRGGPTEALMPISELAQLSRVMAETEEREREQGLFVPVAEVQEIASRVFSLISAFLSELDAQIDPNGVLPNDIRKLVRDNGRAVALNVHAEMKHMLAGNASPKPRNAPRAGSSHGSARKSRAGRKGGGRVSKPAG